MTTISAGDLQSQFEARAPTGDFLNAGKLEEGTGLCLSGGGYRAMLYHVGAVLRLNELRLLSPLKEIASVSGGSITAGVLAHAWPRLQFDEARTATNLIEEFAEPLIRFASVAVDVKAALLGLLPGRTAADQVAAAYDKHLFPGGNAPGHS